MSDASASGNALRDPFPWQAEQFEGAPTLRSEEALALMVQAGRPEATDEMLDVACGAGSLVAAFAPHVRRAVGLDARKTMLKQGRRLAREQALQNVDFCCGNVDPLPFRDQSFDVVTCHFAFHHLRWPASVLAEMHRVCRRGGRIVVCDALLPQEAIQGLEFEKMQRHRDPNLTRYFRLKDLLRQFAFAGLPPPEQTLYRLPVEREELIAASFPVHGRAQLREMIEDSVARDRLGMEARREGDTVHLCYHVAILTAVRTAAATRPRWLPFRRREAED